MTGARLWAAAAVASTVALVARGAGGAERAAFVVRPLVSDGGVAARVHDAQLVNAWGLAASPTGPWWTANEARNSSTLYAGSGAKQHLTVRVGGGPTGVVYNGTKGFAVAARGTAGPA